MAIVIGFLVICLVIRLIRSISLSSKGIISSVIMVNESGMELAGSTYTINAYKDKMEFVLGNRRNILPYDRIEDMIMTTDIEKVYKDKGVLGRSVVGGALGGPAGAVVGGMSGKGKQGTQYWPRIIITYRNKDKELNHLVFVSRQISGNENMFITSFNKKVSKLIVKKERVREL